MKLRISYLKSAWFLRLGMFDDDCTFFNREELPKGSGEMWYTSS